MHGARWNKITECFGRCKYVTFLILKRPFCSVPPSDMLNRPLDYWEYLHMPVASSTTQQLRLLPKQGHRFTVNSPNLTGVNILDNPFREDQWAKAVAEYFSWIFPHRLYRHGQKSQCETRNPWQVAHPASNWGTTMHVVSCRWKEPAKNLFPHTFRFRSARSLSYSQSSFSTTKIV